MLTQEVPSLSKAASLPKPYDKINEETRMKMKLSSLERDGKVDANVAFWNFDVMQNGGSD